MDITKVNGVINQNSGFTGRKLNIIDTHLKNKNKEYEKKDVILKTPHPVPYDSILE